MIFYLKQRIKECVKEASRQNNNSNVKERLKRAIQERMNANPDESKLEPLALPTAIVATKYDIFETYEPEKQKIISKALRFISHYFGATLIVSIFFYRSDNDNEFNSYFYKKSSLAIKMRQLRVD